MKTQTFFTAFASLLIVGATAMAQNVDPNDDMRNTLQLGIKGGFNYSDLYDTKGDNFVNSPMFGPAFGGFLSIPIGTYLGFQPEALYSAKGFTGTGTTGDGQLYSFTDRMNYLDIPLMIQLKPSPYVYLLGGPDYSYLLSRYYTFTQGVTSVTTQQEFENDNIRHNVFGLIFGLDINFSRHWTLGGRLAWDLMDNNGDGTSILPRYRNSWLQTTLAYRFM